MALIKCKECGKEISDKAEMCPNCGCPIELKKIFACEKCGTIVDDNAIFCPNCNGLFEIKCSEHKRYWENLDAELQKILTKEFYHRKDVIPMSTRVGLTICFILEALFFCGPLVNDYGLWWLFWMVLFIGIFCLIYNVVKGTKDEEKFREWLRNKYNIYK